MICCNGEELSQIVERRDFDIVVLKDDLREEIFAELIPMVHIRGA